jgi:hypothetical protein
MWWGVSASEKLKALEHPTVEFGHIWCEHCRDHMAIDHYIDGNHSGGSQYGYAGADLAIRNALPQILAVVEALEQIQEPLLENPPMNDYERYVAERSAAALAALDEALT